MTAQDQAPETATNRNIPRPMQREIRQRCGFGCVVCGLPLYEYEHMEGWANVRRHVATEITLLCDRHHKERTNNLLPIEAVRLADANPFNLRTGVSKPYDLHFSGTNATVVIGGNRFTFEYQGFGAVLAPLVIDNFPLISFVLGDDHLLLNLLVLDEYNQIMLQIENNQLLYKTDAWDVEFRGTTLALREGKGEILMEIKFEPPDKVVIDRGRFLMNGIEVVVTPDRVVIPNNEMVISNSTAINVGAGLVLGENPRMRCLIRVSGIPRRSFAKPTV